MKKIFKDGAFAPIFIITIISAVLIISAFLIKNYLKEKNNSLNEESEKTEETKEISQEESFLKDLKDCKDDLKCLAESAKNCQKAKVDYKIKTNLFGVIQTTESIFAILKKENEKCVFYLKYKKFDFVFPPGTPKEDMEQVKAVYKALEGRDGTCKFEPQKLSQLLERWNAGKFSTEDFKEGECQGKYFESPSLEQ